MTASELAESLERAYEKIGSDGWQSIYDDVMSAFPIIIKSLRFAADMERLVPKCWSVEITGPWTDGGCVIQTQNEACQGLDIYSAARKAVESLEGNQ